MNFLTPPKRTRVLVVLLAVVAAGWIQVTVYTWNLERSLQAIAQAKTLELDMHLKSLETQLKHVHLVPQVTVAREYLVFGPATGKVHILLRTETPIGLVKFGAFDYFFTRNGSQWMETDSGFCGDGEMQSEGRAVFAYLRR